MTWIPIFHQITRPILASTLLISITSVSLFGVSLSSSDTVVSGQPSTAAAEEEEEMKKWSSTLSNPNHLNYNPFNLRNN